MITTLENLHNHGPILFFGFSDSAEAVTNKIPDVFTARTTPYTDNMSTLSKAEEAVSDCCNGSTRK